MEKFVESKLAPLKSKFNFANRKSVSRLLAVQAIYMMENNGARYINNIDLLIKDISLFQRAKSNKMMLRSLINFALDCGSDIDLLIDTAVENDNSKSRVSFFGRIIMITAIAEVICLPKTPLYTILSEFVLIANVFVDELEVKFINAVLNIVGKNKRNTESVLCAVN